MPYLLDMPNGETIKVPDDMSEQDALSQWQGQLVEEMNAQRGPDQQIDMENAPTPNAQYASQMEKISNDPEMQRNRNSTPIGRAMMAEVRNVGNQVGNIAGQVSNEDLADEKALQEGLTGWQSTVGSGLGDTLALGPLGGARALGVKVLAKTLPRVAAALAGPGGIATVEGMGGGAILAGPDHRKAGAVVGGIAGGALAKLSNAGAKLTRDGLVKANPEAESVLARMNAESGANPRPRPFGPDNRAYLPPSQMYPEGSAPNTVERAFRSLPKTEAMFNKQLSAAEKSAMEMSLREAYPKVSDDVVNEFRRGGWQSAANLGNQLTAKLTGPNKNFTKPMREAVTLAGRGRAPDEVTPRVLAQTLRKQSPAAIKAGDPLKTEQNTQLLKTAQTLERVFEPQATASQGTRQLAAVATGAGKDLGMIKTLINFLPLRVFATKGFHNWLGGKTKWQMALQDAVASGSGQQVMRVGRAMRRAFSAEAGETQGG